MARPRKYDEPMTARSVRVPDSLWAEALAVAEARGEPLSDVMVKMLRGYVVRGRRQAARGTVPGPAPDDPSTATTAGPGVATDE